MIEELYHSAGCMHILYQNSLSMFDIMEFGTEEQNQQAVDHYMETGWPIASLSISEPGAGSDNGSMTCVARSRPTAPTSFRPEDLGHHGQKLPYTIVVAKDEDPSRENRNMSLWYIPMDTPGVSTASLHKIGQRCIPFCEVYFDDVVVTERAAHGQAGRGGFMMLMKNFEVERSFIVAEQVGLAQAALEDAAKYANQRIAFGKPITKLQMIQGEALRHGDQGSEHPQHALQDPVEARQRRIGSARLRDAEALQLLRVLPGRRHGALHLRRFGLYY